jgi:predicted phage terminase large subunit-like protein
VFLKELFPDVLWDNPRSECIKNGVSWSDDKGVTVKRKSNPAAATIEANGLTDGMPTGKHYSLLVYDDIVTLESVSTPDQIQKTTNALLLSYNLGAHGGHRRFIGTRYHSMDTYDDIMQKGTVKPRIYPAEIRDIPQFLTREALDTKRRDFGPYVYACQMLQDPLADNAQGFKLDWKRLYRNYVNPSDMNIYIVVDPANSKKQSADYTTMFVIGLSPDNNYYILDIVRDRLNLTERAEALFQLHQQWNPISVGYERYGMQSDIQHLHYVMDQRGYHFNIIELAGRTSKIDRIRTLIPLFEQGRVWFPETVAKVNYEGRVENLTEIFFTTEFMTFPVCSHDDMLDCLARILDEALNAIFPMKYGFSGKIRQKRAM